MTCEGTIWLVTTLISRERHGFSGMVELLALSLANVSGMIMSVVTLVGEEAVFCSERGELVACLSQTSPAPFRSYPT